ncbi:MAG: plasmid pRiA4b family protein, partial [Moraxellaceae bacterium]|nr:plasmid pRiA4b family protein [Moraxellaceae bacterium]
MARRASRFRPDTLQLKVTLRGSKPAIWRRLLVPGNFNLAQLHLALQIGMGWQESHLHQFVAGEDCYGPDDSDNLSCPKDEAAMMLQKVLRAEGDTLIYEYDFGDGWEHTVLLEKFIPYAEGEPLPRCIDGKRACPPEDCGGVGGYAYLLKVMA